MDRAGDDQPVVLAQLLHSHEQFAEVEELWAEVEVARRPLVSEVEVATVDSFQGQERDVVVMSLVRCGSSGVGATISKAHLAAVS